MIDIVKNHKILTAIVGSPEAEHLLQDKYVRSTQFGSLRYGWGVVLLIAWMQNLMQMKSKEMATILLGDKSTASKATLIYNMAKRALITRDVKAPLVVGGNLILPRDMTLTKADAASAYAVTHDSELTAYLSRHAASKYGVNRICTNDLERLISLIDFPIPSIAILLKVLGFCYVVEQPLLDEGALISVAGDRQGKLCVMYGKAQCYYKIMSFLTLADQMADGMILSAMSPVDAASMEIETNHIEVE